MKHPIAARGPPLNRANSFISNLSVSSKLILVLPDPFWDGSRVVFKVSCDAGLIPCAISRAALDVLGRKRHFRGSDFIACFSAMRGHIEVVARGKLNEMPGGRASLAGTLNIWVSDLNELPPYGGAAESQRLTHRLSA